MNAAEAVHYMNEVQSELGGSELLPAFLMGDFNATPKDGYLPNEEMFNQFRDDAKNSWQDAWVLTHPGKTSNLNCNDVVKGKTKPCTFYNDNREKWGRIDFVWVNKPLQTTQAVDDMSIRLAANEKVDGIYPSDHFGLLLTMDFSSSDKHKLVTP